MKASKTAIDKAVQAFQILHGATITPLHCERLIGLVIQAQEAEDEAEAQHAETAPVVVSPAPGYDPAIMAFTKPCCGHPDLCERPCFHIAKR